LGTIWDLSVHDGIEYAGATPEVLIFCNELVMPWRILIAIVAGLVGEDDMQSDVKIAVVHLALQVLGNFAAGEENGARMIRQVFFAPGDQLFAIRHRFFREREKDIVSKHAYSIPPSPQAAL
jgi:hypothetical protein